MLEPLSGRVVLLVLVLLLSGCQPAPSTQDIQHALQQDYNQQGFAEMLVVEEPRIISSGWQGDRFVVGVRYVLRWKVDESRHRKITSLGGGSIDNMMTAIGNGLSSFNQGRKAGDILRRRSRVELTGDEGDWKVTRRL